MPLLDIRNLSVTFATRSGPFMVVDGIDVSVEPNEVVAIVGESGSGKSVAMLAVMGLLPHTATVTADRVVFEGRDLRLLSDRERRAIIGKEIAMIFQEPMSSLNPCFTAGFQIGEVAAHASPHGPGGAQTPRQRNCSRKSASPIRSDAPGPSPISFPAA